MSFQLKISLRGFSKNLIGFCGKLPLGNSSENLIDFGKIPQKGLMKNLMSFAFKIPNKELKKKKKSHDLFKKGKNLVTKFVVA